VPDLIEALQERGHSREAVAEYESMRGDGIAVPPHAIGAAVDAYLTLRQPERSITLFRSLPPDSKPSFGVKSSYFYALLESGRYLDAIAWADGLAAREPMYLDAGTPGLRSENENYVKALVLAGLVPWVSGSCGFTCGCRSWD
jgi:biofilm PGA synthesis protein PgaA